LNNCPYSQGSRSECLIADLTWSSIRRHYGHRRAEYRFKHGIKRVVIYQRRNKNHQSTSTPLSLQRRLVVWWWF
ncbi:MAG: hypothetical protein KAT23_03550, partial [Anaerolineales bacterium]|nr:hypothetical protein [Anaerolineales bacterium]